MHYNPIPHDYSKDYLTFVALEDGATFTFNGKTLNGVTNKAIYSIDEGTTWSEIESGISTLPVNKGEKILWKGEMIPNTSWDMGIGNFTSTKTFDVEGNIMSLLYGDNFKGEIDLTGKNGAFYQIFYNDTNILNADKLSLPATILSTSCYERMFSGCTNLTTAPELPATTLAESCYLRIFYNCTNLVTVPELTATTLAESCYVQMFFGCTSLTTAPELSATTLVGTSCYRNMFNGCRNLSYIKVMFTTEPSTSYTSNWVRNVASTGTFVKNSAATWNVSGVNGIPEGWTIETATA